MPAPVLAQQEVMLEAFVAQLNAPAAPEAQMGAFSACLLGDGDAAVTAKMFGARGWTVGGDSEMGIVEMSHPDSPVYVTLYLDGAICSVAHMEQGTAAATEMLTDYLQIVGIATPSGTDGCAGWDIGNGRSIGLTSGGQDPVCDSEVDNDVRFVFPEGQE